MIFTDNYIDKLMGVLCEWDNGTHIIFTIGGIFGITNAIEFRKRLFFSKSFHYVSVYSGCVYLSHILTKDPFILSKTNLNAKAISLINGLRR